MRDFKKGDKVLMAATVLEDGTDMDGDVAIDAGGSDGCSYASPSNCTLIEPDELKVGDWVSVHGCVADGKITACWLDPTKFDVRADDGSWIASAVTADCLTKVPPKGKYRVERRDDFLYLMWLPPNKMAWRSIPVSPWTIQGRLPIVSKHGHVITGSTGKKFRSWLTNRKPSTRYCFMDVPSSRSALLLDGMLSQ